MLSRKFLLNLLPLVLIIFLASVLRLWMLGNVPISFSDDEIRQVYTSYSIAHSGKDIFGNFLPLVFKIDGYNTWGQTSIYLSSITYLFTDLTPLTAKLPYALFSIFSIIFFYATVKKIFNNAVVAAFSSFVLSVSIWNIQISRLAMDINTSLFMYIIAIFIFLHAKKRTGFLILSMIFFFLAFYSYAATRVVFLPLILVFTWYKFKDLTKKHLVIIVLGVVLAFGSYGYLGITQGAAIYSGSPFFFQDKATTDLSVELERRASNEPNIIETLYLNKFTYWEKVFLNSYLNAFSPQYLFLGAERDGRFAIWERGELYIIEIPLLLLGTLFLFAKRRREFYLIFALLLISPLPSGVGLGGLTWVSRAGLMIYWLSIFIGYGIYSLVTIPKKIYYKYLILLIILLFYGYSLTGYLFQYYYNWSQTNAQYFSKSTKDLVEKVNNYQSRGKHIVVSGGIGNTLLHLAFYNKIDPTIVQKIYNNKPILFQNIVFMEDCWIHSGNPYDKIRADNVYISKASCRYEATPSAKIKEYAGSETVWNIYEK